MAKVRKNWIAEHLEKYQNDPEFKAKILGLLFYNEMLRIMKEKGISQAELAVKLGCSEAYITELFNDSATVTIQTMAKITMALGCDLKISITR